MSQRIELAGASFSDPDLLGYVAGSDDARIQLKYLNVETDDFADLSAWDETDSGGNVNLAGGVVSLNGNGNWGANGIARSAGVSRALGYFEWKERGLTPSAGSSVVGMDAAKVLITGLDIRVYRQSTVYLSMTGYFSAAVPDAYYDFIFDATMWYTFRAYIKNNVAGNPRVVELTIQGGVGDYATEQVVARLIGVTDLPATLYWLAQRRPPNAVKLMELKEWRWYAGFSTGDPVATLVDIDGNASGTWDASSIDFNGDTSGITFSYACGETPSPSNWSSYLTLANLQAETDWIGRYTKIRAKFGSDGDTQRTLTEGEINHTPASGGTMARGRRAAAVA